MAMVVPTPVVLIAMMMFVPVMPEFGLVQQEEEDQPEQQYAEQHAGLDPAFEGFRQQVHEGSGQERTRRQAQQMLRIHTAFAISHTHAQQKGSDPDTSDAGDQGRGDDG
jgi:hypothetical protein